MLTTNQILYPKAATDDDVHEPASNTAAKITYAAVQGYGHVVVGVAWSYDQTPTGGNIKIEDGAGNTIFTVDIVAAGPDSVFFGLPKWGTASTAMIITLAAGGVGVTGKVNGLGHWTLKTN